MHTPSMADAGLATAQPDPSDVAGAVAVPMTATHDPASYRSAFAKAVLANDPAGALRLVNDNPGTEWNFLYPETGLTPLCTVVDPSTSNVSQQAMCNLINALVSRGGARLDWPAPTAANVRPDRHHAAFIAASYGQASVLELIIELGYSVTSASPVARDDPSGNQFATLAHAAASSGSYPTLDVLVRHGASLTTVDECGRSPLHAMLYWAPDAEIGSLLLESGAPAFQEDGAGNAPFAMALSVCPELAKEMLMSRSEQKKQLGSGAIWRHRFLKLFVHSNGTQVLFRDFHPKDGGGAREGITTGVVPGDVSEKAGKVAAPSEERLSALSLVVKYKRKDLLETPIVKAVLHEGWQRVCQRIWRMLVVEYTLFVLCFAGLLYAWPIVADLQAGATLPWNAYVLYAIVVVLAVRSNYRAGRAMWIVGGRAWATSIWNVADLFLQSALTFVLITQLMVFCGRRQTWTANWVNGTAVVQILFGVKFLRFACVPQATGMMVSMVIVMMNDIARFFAFFLPFYLPFTSAFYALFREGVALQYKSVVMVMFRWVFGDVDYSIFASDLPPDNVSMGQTMYILYEIVVVVVLVNILIALLSNTFYAVVESGEAEWLYVFAKEYLEIFGMAPIAAVSMFYRDLAALDKKPMYADKPADDDANWVLLVRNRMELMLKQQAELLGTVANMNAGTGTLSSTSAAITANRIAKQQQQQHHHHQQQPPGDAAAPS